MEKPPPHLVQNPMISFKTKDYQQKAKGISFFAFLFSIFIYISIFYVFNLSPSSLLHNNKFWFSISNTLILIIAVDYGYFSSSAKASGTTKYDIYDQDAIMKQTSSVDSPISCRTRYSQFSSIHSIDDQNPQTKRKLKYQKSLPIVRENDMHVDAPSCFHGKSQPEGCALKRDKEYYLDSCHKKKKKVSPLYLSRSRSDSSKRVVFDESKNIVRRFESEKDLEPSDHSEQETDAQSARNEYADLSTEELNRRVEDFIQRFNMQIRLQGETTHY